MNAITPSFGVMKDIKTEVHLYYDGGHSVILSILFTDRVVSSNETLFNLILGLRYFENVCLFWDPS